MGRQEEIKIKIENIAPSVSVLADIPTRGRSWCPTPAPLSQSWPHGILIDEQMHVTSGCQNALPPHGQSLSPCTSLTHALQVQLQKFAELIQCPEVLVAHHKHLNDNEWIKVGPFEEAHRRVAYITPWECSSKRLKRLVRESSGLLSSCIPLACILLRHQCVPSSPDKLGLKRLSSARDSQNRMLGHPASCHCNCSPLLTSILLICSL